MGAPGGRGPERRADPAVDAAAGGGVGVAGAIVAIAEPGVALGRRAAPALPRRPSAVSLPRTDVAAAATVAVAVAAAAAAASCEVAVARGGDVAKAPPPSVLSALRLRGHSVLRRSRDARAAACTADDRRGDSAEYP
jgi:hypothetical protein